MPRRYLVRSKRLRQTWDPLPMWSYIMVGILLLSKYTRSRFVFTFRVSRCFQPSANSRRSILSTIRAIHQVRHRLRRFHCVLLIDSASRDLTAGGLGAYPALQNSLTAFKKLPQGTPKVPRLFYETRRERFLVDKTNTSCMGRYSSPRATSSGSPPHLRHQTSSP